VTRAKPIFLCPIDEEPEPDTTSGCPNAAEHTPAPSGYVSWHEWAKRMGKTHHQQRCPGCDLLKIWVPKSPKATPEETDQP
jgi:hypothetical protein